MSRHKSVGQWDLGNGRVSRSESTWKTQEAAERDVKYWSRENRHHSKFSTWVEKVEEK